MRTAKDRPRILRIALLVMSVILSGAGCSNPSGGKNADPDPRAASDGRQQTDIPMTTADIIGTITVARPGADTRPSVGSGAPSGSVSCPPDCGVRGTPLQTVLIEENPATTSGDNKSSVTVLKTARLLRQTSSGVEPITFADLKVGQRAHAWFTGPVRESYPSQADARVIVIREE